MHHDKQPPRPTIKDPDATDRHELVAQTAVAAVLQRAADQLDPTLARAREDAFAYRDEFAGQLDAICELVTGDPLSDFYPPALVRELVHERDQLQQRIRELEADC